MLYFHKNFYYNIQRKILARYPSKSNLKIKGSDNSLFFGICDNKKISNIFKEIFNVNDIHQISNLSFLMKFLDEKVNVDLNVNNQGQIQIKICGDGTMRKLLNLYIFYSDYVGEEENLLLVLDFKEMTINFTDSFISINDN